jgi:hypothetical protein
VASQAEFRLFWSDPVDVDVRRESGDPLGLRSWANRVAQQLVPGLRNGTDRVQGFGLICAALALADRAGFLDLGTDETFLRLERAWVLSQAAHRRSNEGVSPWPGNRQAQQFLNDKTADLGAPLLSRQLQMGTWGMYRRAGGALGLIQPASRSRSRVTAPHEARLTAAGRIVGQEWIDYNVPSAARSALSRRLKATEVPITKVVDLFNPDLPPNDEVADALTAALELHGVEDAELRALRAVWDAAGDLGVRSLKKYRHCLTPDQALVLPQAAAVQSLCRRLELPFRRYLRHGPTAAAPGEGLLTSSVWKAVPRGEDDVRRLHTALLQSPKTWLGVHRRALELAQSRGHDLSEPGSAPKGYDRAPGPALSLKAAEALFSQGFIGAPNGTKDAQATLCTSQRLMSREEDW